jgi:formylglycine-generating enzyme required for sulfatase activity
MSVVRRASHGPSFAPAAVGALAALVACAPAATSTPVGNVVLFVDTDAPVPKLASDLRIDLFTTDGTWYASRDVAAASPSSWPASFGVYLPQGVSSAQVLVRLRAYPVGSVRDYHGYAYLARPTGDSTTDVTSPPTPATDGPRLVVNGTDVTPTSEPAPGVTIDRLVLVPVTEGIVGSVQVTLAGACFGTMADMRDSGALATCVDTEAELAPLSPESIDPGLDAPASVQGTFEAPYAQPCTGAPRPPTTAADGTPLHDDDVCVTGGAFVLGSFDDAIDDPTDDDPEAVALIPSFYMDRYEVTVGRYRAAVASGMPVAGVYANDGPIQGEQDAPTMCTWSDAPMGREEMPITCMVPSAARTFCQFVGGDLPLEAEWEYATAMSGGRPAKTSYAWGNGSDLPPACTDVVYSRGSLQLTSYCTSAGYGPAPVTTADHPGGDQSIGLLLVDLGRPTAGRASRSSFRLASRASGPRSRPAGAPGT